MVNIKTLRDTSFEIITNTFNLSFSDYFVTIRLTTEQLQAKMGIDKVNPDYSVGVFEDENLIAFILHGTDDIDNKKVVYNGGTGVVPDKRGQGLTKKMYEFILPVLKEQRVDYLILEAITKNIQAIKSYEKVGYRIKRELKCYNGQIKPVNRTNDFEIRELACYDWTLMRSFWDFIPTWQNSVNVIDRLKESNKSIGAYLNSKLVGYLIYNPGSKRIQQFAVDKSLRRMGIASALIDNIVKEYGNDLSVVNVDESSEQTNSFILKTGLDNYLDQIEMKLELT